MQKFSIREAFKFGWETFKKYPVFLISVVLIMGIISYLPGMLNSSMTNNGQDYNPLVGIISLVAYVLQLIVSMGVIKIAITLARGGKPEWDDLYTQYPKFFNYFIASILYGLMVLVGLIVFVVPGIYLAIKFQMYSYLIVDKNLGPIEALKQSSIITKGSMWNLFLFGLTAVVVIIVGAMLFLVGLLIAAPVAMVAGGYVYNKLSK